MATGTIQTYVAMHDRVPIFADTEKSRLTAGATAYLVRGTTFSGQATNKNNTIWLADGSGFVSDEAVAPCYRYSVSAVTRVLEDHRPDALQAERGTAFKRPGEQFDAAIAAQGWLWIISGIGYIPAAEAYIVGVAQATYPSVASSVAGQRIYVVEPNDDLSKISAKFYNGDQSHAYEIYEVPANKELIGPNPDQIQAGWRLIIP